MLGLQLVVRWTLVEGVRRQFDAVREGFEQIFPVPCLNFFYPEEVISQCLILITISDLYLFHLDKCHVLKQLYLVNLFQKWCFVKTNIFIITAVNNVIVLQHKLVICLYFSSCQCSYIGLLIVNCVLAVGWIVLWMPYGVVGRAVLDRNMSARPRLHTWFSACPFSLRDSEQLRCCRAKPLCPICYWISAAANRWSVLSVGCEVEILLCLR